MTNESHQQKLIFSLMKSINDLKSENIKLEKDLDYITLKDAYLNEYTSNFVQANKRNAIIEHLLLKLNKLTIEKAKINLVLNEHAELSSEFDFKLKIAGLVSTMKSKTLNEHNKGQILVESILVLVQFRQFKKSHMEDLFALELELSVLIRNVFKKVILFIIEASTLVDDFFAEMFVFFKELRSIKLSVEYGSLSNLYAIKKYFKCLDSLLDYMEKGENVSESSKFMAKDYMENLFQHLIGSGFFTRISQELARQSQYSIFISDLFIRSIVASFRLLICFELINQQDNLRLTPQITTSLKEVYFSENFFTFDLIFAGQDDDKMIEFNSSCMSYQIQMEKLELTRVSLLQEIFHFDLNYHVLFVKLVASVLFDYQVLVDWLISNETTFLSYLVKYLKRLQSELSANGRTRLESLFSNANENKFKQFSSVILSTSKRLIKKTQTAHGGSVYYLDQTFQLLVELLSKIKLMKKSFPYNCEPLIKLLDKTVNLI